VLAGAALFGTIGTAQALGPDVPTPQLAAVRLLLSALLLTAVAIAVGHRAALGSVARTRPALLAGLAQASFNLTFLGAMDQAGVAVGTLVAIGATPILTGLATRHTSPAWVVATGVAVVGLVVLVTGQLAADPSSAVRPSGTGIALALGASASYATYIVAGKAAAAQGLPTQPYLAVVFAVAALVTAPLMLLGEMGWSVSREGILLLAYLSVVTTLVAYSLFNRGLRGVRSGTASTLGLVEPVVAALLAFLLLGERLTAAGLAGAALVLLGLLLVVRTADPGAAPLGVSENGNRAADPRRR
jgi:DME family drug/metabolite transporter